MDMLSSNLSKISISQTIAISTKAAELRRDGHDVIALSAGEPDFDTPDHIQKAAISAIKDGHTRYTPPDGITDLKAAISEKFARENQLSYAMDEVLAANGGKQIIFNALLATLNPGDEVIIVAPYWVSYPDMVAMLGGKPVILSAKKEDGYKLDPAMLREAITPKTKWLILNSPSNPTGAVLSKEALQEFGTVLADFPDVLVLCDDIYEHLVFDQSFYTLAQVCPDLSQRVLTMNGVSKAYAMTGWRLGYCGGPSWLIGAMKKVQSQSTSNASSISQHAAIAALSGPQDFISTSRPRFKARRDLVTNGLNEIRGFNAFKAEGAFYAFVDISALIGSRTKSGEVIDDDAKFCLEVLNEARVALVPGSAFGCDNHFRLSFATSESDLSNALERLDRFAFSLS